MEAWFDVDNYEFLLSFYKLSYLLFMVEVWEESEYI